MHVSELQKNLRGVIPICLYWGNAIKGAQGGTLSPLGGLPLPSSLPENQGKDCFHKRAGYAVPPLLGRSPLCGRRT